MKIAVLGYGVVGKGVVSLANENGMEVKYILMRDIDELTLPNMTKKLSDIVNDQTITCVVECIGGDEPAHTYVKSCLEKGLNVISSNKKMIVKHFAELVELSKQNHCHFLFSAACGGAIPWLSELSKVSATDEVYHFQGIMNGTSNYILNKMYYENLSFKDALTKAQELGYAESDPSDDIDGVDTANKGILSMGIAYHKLVKLEDVFIKGIRHFDLPDLKFLKAHDYKCVLLATGCPNSLRVIPSFIKADSTFFGIRDNYNCFKLDSKNFGPFALIGQGAGSLPTASNIIRDLMMLEYPYVVSLNENLVPNYDEQKHCFYIRGNHLVNNDYVKEVLGENTYLTKAITINELKQLIKEEDFVGEIIDD